MLEHSKVSRSLEKKTQILWLEIMDIFALVTICSLLNLAFGATHFKLYLVYLPTLFLGGALIAAKRGRAEGFLMHYLKFHLQPKHLSCFFPGPNEFRLSRNIRRKAK
jgi:hypothetical protein